MTNDRAAIFLAGLGLGVAGALWFAPHEGKETRRRIKMGASDAADQLSGLFEKGRANMSDLKDKAKDRIDEAADATKKTVDTVIDRSKDVAHNAGKKMEEAGKRLQDA